MRTKQWLITKEEMQQIEYQRENKQEDEYCNTLMNKNFGSVLGAQGADYLVTSQKNNRSPRIH